MKKLLAILLVLGMASLASAAMTLSAPTGINESDIVQIVIGNDDEAGAIDHFAGFLAVDTSGPGELTGNFSYAPGALYGGYGGSVYYGVTPGSLTGLPYDADLMLCDITDGTPTAQPDGDLMYVEFHCTGLGDVTVNLLDFSFGEVLSVTIQQVPEPMTLSLLGLGGLLLRRRR